MNRIAAGAVAMALGFGSAAGVSHAQTNHGAHGEETMQDMSAASQAYMDAMTAMDDAMGDMEMTGKPGADFALMMIPHHQSAIDMAKAYLESGDGDPELTKLSNEIIAAQETEIAFLRDWLEKNKE
ncbi:DUF305 domain-containing protein [Mesorhizobium sp. CAU 1732]|uniref:DUF305 domain-containing protein n=1 Tax=Mesorhizobium sp. CAU 1732 TaxID=3140358 RepID=UPI0032618606